MWTDLNRTIKETETHICFNMKTWDLRLGYSIAEAVLYV